MKEVASAILRANNYCTLATVTADGAPWGTPIHFAYDETTIYWLSQPDTVHSLNIERDGRVFITVFDSRQLAETLGDRGAVYISSRAAKLTGDAALAARDVYNDRYPDDNNRKLYEWDVYAVPIGELNEDKSNGQMIYFLHEGSAE